MRTRIRNLIRRAVPYVRLPHGHTVLPPPMFVIIDKATGSPLRIRDRSARTDPVVCFETRATALEWMRDTKVTIAIHEVREIDKDHYAEIGGLLGIPAADVNFTLLRSKSPK